MKKILTIGLMSILLMSFLASAETTENELGNAKTEERAPDFVEKTPMPETPKTGSPSIGSGSGSDMVWKAVYGLRYVSIRKAIDGFSLLDIIYHAWIKPIEAKLQERDPDFKVLMPDEIRERLNEEKQKELLKEEPEPTNEEVCYENNGRWQVSNQKCFIGD